MSRLTGEPADVGAPDLGGEDLCSHQDGRRFVGRQWTEMTGVDPSSRPHGEDPDWSAFSPVVPPSRPPSRPRKVWLISILLGFFGVLGLLVTAFLFVLISERDSHGQSVPPLLRVLVYGQLVLSMAQVISGVSVWRGRTWGHRLAVIVCVINLIGTAVSVFTVGWPQALTGAAVNIALIALLSNPEIADWCGL